MFLIEQTLVNKKRGNVHLLKGLNLYYTNIKNINQQEMGNNASGKQRIWSITKYKCPWTYEETLLMRQFK